jgi:signal transduction histidine kinase
MRLGEFIVASMEPILIEWEAFAATQLPAGASMTHEGLRNHASQMLTAIAKDLSEPQSAEAQSQKSKGLAPIFAGAPETAAETNALLRAQGGFDINQMAAEYRALRASVLRLWAKDPGSATTDLQDTIRFNEAIDQALAESIAFFSAELERSRNLLLGMLGHDMRNPLSAILITARYLTKLNAGEAISKAARRLISSGARIQALLSDLVDFNRTNLGVGIHIVPSEVDLERVFVDQLELLRAANPGREMAVNVTGNVLGHWDANRIHQVLGNLVTNALKYGSVNTPVRVGLMGDATHITFFVANHGPVIPLQFMADMFEPLRRGPARGPDIEVRDDGSLGLGLYISREIVLAHGGDIAVRSDERETAFTVKLPRLGSAVRTAQND